MRPETTKPLPFDSELDPALTALHAACDGTRDITALVSVVRAVEPGLDEAAVWSMLDDLHALGCLGEAAAPPVERGLSRRSLFRRLAFGAAAAATAVAVRPAHAFTDDGFDLDDVDEFLEDELDAACSFRKVRPAGQQEARQKRARQLATEQRRKATQQFGEEREKALAAGDQRSAEQARKKFQAQQTSIREQKEKQLAARPLATIREQQKKQQVKETTRLWKAEPGAGRTPGFLDFGSDQVLEGEVDVLRTKFLEEDGVCGGLTTTLHFRSRKGESGIDKESLAARGFDEIYRTLQGVVRKASELGPKGEPFTVAWGIDEGLAWSGSLQEAAFSFTAWDEAGEPSEGTLRLTLI